MHRIAVTLAIAVLITGCARPQHDRLYRQTNENPRHAIRSDSAFAPFEHPGLRTVFEYFSLIVRNRATSTKSNIKLSSNFWYQNSDPAQGDIYTKLVFDMGYFDGYKEWNPFLGKIESRFLEEWMRAKADIEAKYGLEAYLLYAFNPEERTGSFTLTIRKIRK